MKISEGTSEKKGIGERMPWLFPALKSKRNWKSFLRCWLVIIAALVLMVDTKTSQAMGAAAFFCVIVALMLPPSMATSVFIFAIITLILGVLLGWAWGNAAMAAALQARSSSLLAQQQQKLQSTLKPNISPALQVQVAVFHGFFLDPRSSAVYGAFFFVGTFALGVIRAYIPNLALLTIFGTIFVDVICSTGPLLPAAQYTLAKTFLIPISFYVGVAVTGLILIFPESLNQAWLTAFVDDFWTPSLDLLHAQDEALRSNPSDREAWTELYAKTAEKRFSLIENTDSLFSQISLIDLDFSVGRLGPADLRKIHGHIRSIMFRITSLQVFQAFVKDKNDIDERIATTAPQTRQRYNSLHLKVNEREDAQGHNLDSLMPILASCSAPLRSACQDTVLVARNWLQDANGRRWSGLVSRSTQEQIAQRHEILLNGLRTLDDALKEFRNVKRVELVKPYESCFDPETRRLKKKGLIFASRSLFTCFVFIDTLDAFAEQLANFMKDIIEIDSQRTKTRFWFPGRFSKATETITNNEYKNSAGPFAMGTAEDPTTFETVNDAESAQSTIVNGSAPGKQSEKGVKVDNTTPRRNPDAFPPRTAFGRLWIKLAALPRFFKSPEGIFALRHAIVSIALWIPSVCPSSAWFYYENKGLWALIMAQIGLALYAGDQIANFVIRMTGTILGLLLGMAVWYIGAGNGNGNPYGIVIANAVFLAPFVFARIALPPQQMAFWTMVAVTIVFVTGYSWTNAHLNSIGNPGVGVTLGWKRALLVIIGFAASFIVMLFPAPLSSRVLVRKTLAATLSETGNMFADEVEALLAEEAINRSRTEQSKDDSRKGGDEEEINEQDIVKEERVKKTGRRALAVVVRLKELHPSLTFARFEPQLSGTWPHEEYTRLFELQSKVLSSLVLLITSFSKLDARWCTLLVRKTPFLNPNFLSDIFTTVAILSNSLAHGTPLPAYLPSLRERLVYHEMHSFRGKLYKNWKSLDDVQEDPKKADIDNSGDVISPTKIDGSSVGIETEELTLDVLLDEHLPAHSTAVAALSSLISHADEVAEIIRKLCGEATFQGYDDLHRYYADQEKAV